MARPRKDPSELKAPRRLKTLDGQPVRPKGRPPKTGANVIIPAEQYKKLTEPEVPDDVTPTNYTPLEYALTVMNDPREPKDRRDRLAVAAMPYVHAKKGESGKREKAESNANKVSQGKFSRASAPKLSVVNK